MDEESGGGGGGGGDVNINESSKVGTTSDEVEYWADQVNINMDMARSSSVVMRLYECVFCKRGLTTAQALGGHMNIHRKDRGMIRTSNMAKSSIPSSSSSSCSSNIIKSQLTDHYFPETNVPENSGGSNINATTLVYHPYQTPQYHRRSRSTIPEFPSRAHHGVQYFPEDPADSTNIVVTPRETKSLDDDDHAPQRLRELSLFGTDLHLGPRHQYHLAVEGDHDQKTDDHEEEEEEEEIKKDDQLDLELRLGTKNN